MSVHPDPVRFASTWRAAVRDYDDVAVLTVVHRGFEVKREYPRDLIIFGKSRYNANIEAFRVMGDIDRDIGRWFDLDQNKV